MANSSLAAQAVVDSASSAPPSFDGMEWLVAVNLAWSTAAFFIFAMVAGDMVKQLCASRRSKQWSGWRLRDFLRAPLSIWRCIGLCLGLAGTIRYGIGAAVLWGWSPADPGMSGWLLTMQRLLDPIGMTLGLGAIVLFKLSQHGMHEQLRKQPYPVNMWASLPMLKRPAIIAGLSLVAAIGVVSTR